MMTTQESSDSWREQSNNAWDDADYRDADYLQQRYWEDGLTAKEIAQENDVVADTVLKWLKKTGVGTRDKNERRKNHVGMTLQLRRSLQGQALGDGYLGQPNSGGGTYLQEVDTERSYLIWLKDYFEELGITGNVAATDQEEMADWRYSSSKVMELNEIRQRWYESDGLSIPGDFEISPTAMFFWYLGDGCLSEAHGKPTVYITGYKLAESFEMVVDQLADEGITASKFDGGIRIWLESHDDWFDYLRSSGVDIPDAYAYKFPNEDVDDADHAGVV